MEPIAVWAKEKGEWSIIHRCTKCGALRSNRIAADDNEAILLTLAVRPIAMPAFPFDKIGR
jgi:ribosome biogenesis GTPase